MSNLSQVTAVLFDESRPTKLPSPSHIAFWASIAAIAATSAACGTSGLTPDRARHLGYPAAALMAFENGQDEADDELRQARLESTRWEGFRQHWYLALEAADQDDHAAAFEEANYACWFACPDRVQSFCEETRAPAFDAQIVAGRALSKTNPEQGVQRIAQALAYQDDEGARVELAGMIRWLSIDSVRKTLSLLQATASATDQVLGTIDGVLQYVIGIKNTLQAEFDAATRRIDEVRKEVENARGGLQSLRDEVDKANGSLNQLKQTAQVNSPELQNAQRQLDDANNRLKTAEDGIKRLEGEIGKLDRVLKVVPDFLGQIDGYHARFEDLKKNITPALGLTRQNLDRVMAVPLPKVRAFDLGFDDAARRELAALRGETDKALLAIESQIGAQINDLLNQFIAAAVTWSTKEATEAIQKNVKGTKGDVLAVLGGAFAAAGTNLALQKVTDPVKDVPLKLFRDARSQAVEYLDLLLLQDPAVLLTGVVPTRRYTCSAHEPRRPDLYPQLGSPDLQAEPVEEVANDLGSDDFDLDAWEQGIKAAVGISPGLSDTDAIPILRARTTTLAQQDAPGVIQAEVSQLEAWLHEAELLAARGQTDDVSRLVLRSALLLDHANAVQQLRRFDEALRRRDQLKKKVEAMERAPRTTDEGR